MKRGFDTVARLVAWSTRHGRRQKAKPQQLSPTETTSGLTAMKPTCKPAFNADSRLPLLKVVYLTWKLTLYHKADGKAAMPPLAAFMS